MPYYVHAHESDPTSGREFDSAALAGPNVQPGERMTFHPTRAEDSAWRYREFQRFANGTYSPVPWAETVKSSAELWDRLYAHYAHISKDEPGKIAYTKSVEHGVQDRQTRIRPGKYLSEFLPEFAHLHADWIAEVTRAGLGSAGPVYKVATTAEDIIAVYGSGPYSCMQGKDYVKVYANSDLAVVYTGPIESVSGRAVVWPAKKLYYRIYGDENVIRQALESDGYTLSREGFPGAKIRAIKSRCGDGYVMPFVDGSACMGTVEKDDNGQSWIVLGMDGDFDCQTTSGTTAETSSCPNCGDSFIDHNDTGYCDSCDDSRAYCERCENDNWDQNPNGYCDSCWSELSDCPRCDRRNDDGNTDGYCNRCWENYVSSCDKCDTVSHDGIEYVEGLDKHFCEDCRADLKTCPDCDTIHDTDDLTVAERASRRSAGRLDYCDDCHDSPSCIDCTATADPTSDDSAVVVCLDCRETRYGQIALLSWADDGGNSAEIEPAA